MPDIFEALKNQPGRLSTFSDFVLKFREYLSVAQEDEGDAKPSLIYTLSV